MLALLRYESAAEAAERRKAAVLIARVLCFTVDAGLGRDEVNALANDPEPDVSETAKRLLEDLRNE
jgi:hypothetical protein